MLNSRGDVTHGVGGGYVSLNNTAFSRGAAGGFIDDDTVAFIDGTDDLWVASRYYIPTRTVSKVADIPANHMFAGGGHAAWWLAGLGTERGLHSTTGFRVPDGGLLGMGPDAAVVYKPSYQSNGPTMVRELDGSEWKLTDGHAQYLSAHGERRIVWMERMQVHTCNMPRPLYASDGGIWKTEAMFAGGAWWITYYCGAYGIVLHPFDSFMGFAHLPKGDGWHSARAIDDHTIRVATAVGVAEQAGQIWIRDYDVVANRVRDPWGSNVWASIDRVDIRTINQQRPRVYYSDKNLSCGTFFCYSDRYGDEADVPEHCTVVVEPGAVGRAAARVPIVIGGADAVLEAAVPVKDRVLALYIGDTAGWQNAEAQAKSLKIRWKAKSGIHAPVLWYITPGEPDEPGFQIPPSVDLLGPEFYFSNWTNLSEQHAQKLAMWTAKLGASRPWVPIYQAYDRSAWPARAMEELAITIPSFISQLFEFDRSGAGPPPVIGVLFFAVGRPGGMRTYPALKTAYISIFNALRGPAEWPRPVLGGAGMIPEVTITSYEPKNGESLLRVRAVARVTDPDGRIRSLRWLYRPIGTQTWIEAANNAPDDPDHTYSFSTPGTYEIKLRGVYDGGAAETGLQRLVTVHAVSPPADPDQLPLPTRPQPPDTPPDRPNVMEVKMRSFKTALGHYLRINPHDNRLAADAHEGAPETMFQVAQLAPSRVSLKAFNQKYVCAEGGGGRGLVADRDVVGDWETFTVVRVGGGIALQASNGLFVSPQQGGGGAVLADGPTVGAWEPLVPSGAMAGPVFPGRLRADGRIFRAEGDRPWRWKGVSAFQLLNRFDRGEDIQPFLNAWGQKGANVLRVWPYVPVKDWKDRAWDAPRSHDTVVAFLQICRDAGFYVELTLLLDDDPARIPLATQIVQSLAQSRPENLFLEAGNEPSTHKQIDTRALRSVLEQSGFLYSSGDYEDSTRFFGTFLTTHTGRSPDWPRKAHDLLEFFEGGGPNAPTDPAHKVPAIADEPIRPDEAGGDIDHKLRDFYAYGAACALLGAGATFHMSSGKVAAMPTPEEERCGEAMLAGLSVFPEDAPLGGYRRIVEPHNTDDQRTYVIAERYMVRVRPNSPNCPESGWRSLDSYAIAWTR